MEILTIKDLNFTYPQGVDTALTNVNFSMQEGDFTVICGESGCGKTTLLKMMKRELAPHGKREGTICFCGRPQEELTEKESAGEIGYVLQNPENQVVTDKVWHELAFGLENLGIPQDKMRRRIGEMACFFGIDGWFHKNTSELSGGQKQLLNLASIMVMSPRLLILDEPTSQLDPIAAADFIQTLVRINRELGTTILMTEHRLEEVFPVATQVAVMEKGQIIMKESPRTLGIRLRQLDHNHKMLYGLPSAVRIYQGLDADCPCPLTVREGREFIQTNYRPNEILEDCFLEEETALPSEIVLSLEHVWFRYERTTPDILEDVCLQLYQGEIFSILGSNGSGKSTLLSVISHVRNAYKGKIKIYGKKQKEYKNGTLYRHTLALLPQNPQSVFLKQTLREDYQEIGKVMNYSKEELLDMTAHIADLLGLEHLLDKHPYDLSGGEQQKAALGKMLLLKPKMLLLDEPTKGIDSYTKQSLIQILKDLTKKGITILMVTHDVEFAAEVSDRCSMFFDGKLTSIDRPREFFAYNNYYTTAASRMARTCYPNAITCDEVIALCKRNQEASL